MSIYNRFGDKGGVLLALFVRGFRDLLVHITTDEPAGEASAGSDSRERLRRSAAAYRRFALASPGTYSLMFEQGHNEVEPDDDAMDHAAAAFFALVRQIEEAQATGALVGGSGAELAQRLWATIHGAVSLEIRQIRFVEDPETHFTALVDTVLAGLDPAHGLAGIEGPLVQPRTGEPLAVPR
jgi:AcrR family transcriptional regulator